MIHLSHSLEEKGIQNAVIIDDAFDEIPHPNELDPADWSKFVDDLTEDDHALLSKLYPEFEKTDTDALQKSQPFIDVLWENRKKLSTKPLDILFRSYELNNQLERKSLNNIVGKLEDIGLTCTTVGREFIKEAVNAQLIIIDLFLGPKRSDSADNGAWAGISPKYNLDSDIERVRNFILSWPHDNPPLIILISSNEELYQKKNDFRDKSGLLSSTFRVARKSELAEDRKLEAILSRLVDAYEDSKKLTKFFKALDERLEQSRQSFLQLLRRLDVSDLAQIRTLLLNSEGERLGDYLLDVADRVLHHEIEGGTDVISATQTLNEIDLNTYPAPHLTGTPDFQSLVYRIMFVHPDRLTSAEDGGSTQIQFGDILLWKSNDQDFFKDDIRLVVTPACDLVRNGTDHIMLLSGKMQEFKPENWSYRSNLIRTPIIILPDGNRKWIKWNLKEVVTRHRDDLSNLQCTDQEERYTRIARLREVYAMAIQQKLLTRLGRIGLPADLPASFPVEVSIYYIDTQCTLRSLNIENSELAACYVGRDKDSKSIHHLVLTEHSCDQIRRALRQLTDEDVLPQVQNNLRIAKKDLELIRKLERGEAKISPNVSQEKYLKSEDNTAFYACIVRDSELNDGVSIKPGKYKNAAIIIQVVDL